MAKLLISEEELISTIVKAIHANQPITEQLSPKQLAEKIVKSLSHFRYP